MRSLGEEKNRKYDRVAVAAVRPADKLKVRLAWHRWCVTHKKDIPYHVFVVQIRCLGRKIENG